MIDEEVNTIDQKLTSYNGTHKYTYGKRATIDCNNLLIRLITRPMMIGRGLACIVACDQGTFQHEGPSSKRGPISLNHYFIKSLNHPKLFCLRWGHRSQVTTQCHPHHPLNARRAKLTSAQPTSDQRRPSQRRKIPTIASISQTQDGRAKS